MIRRVALAWIVGIVSPLSGSAQTPPPSPRPVQPLALGTPTSGPTTRAIPLPQRSSQPARGRFANPGGIGRNAEYYTAYTPTTQANPRPANPARFGNGGLPDRAQQIAAFQAGQTRSRNIQDNINVYGRPYGAYGFGFGLGFGLTAGRFGRYPY